MAGMTGVARARKLKLIDGDDFKVAPISADKMSNKASQYLALEHMAEHKKIIGMPRS